MFISLKELRATYEWNWIVTYGAAFVALAIGASLLVVALRAGDRAYVDEVEVVYLDTSTVSRSHFLSFSKNG